MEHPNQTISIIFLLTIFIVLSSSGFVTSDISQDKKECSAQLSNFTVCLPFVGGKVKAPTETCCSNIQKQINTTRKCLCMLVKDRNDTRLGFVINATRALSLPMVCHAPANVTDCPALLNLAPNSKDAQIFYQFGGSNHTSIPIITGSTSSTGTVKGKRWMEMGMIIGGVSLWLQISLYY